MGRPSSFLQETADAICERLAGGESLRKICDGEDMPNASTVFRWLEQHEAFREQYARARDRQADTLADEILDIANTPIVGVIETDKLDREGNPFTEVKRADMIEHRRLQVDARKWLTAKLAPKKYGDKLEHSGSVEGFSLVVKDRA